MGRKDHLTLQPHIVGSRDYRKWAWPPTVCGERHASSRARSARLASPGKRDAFLSQGTTPAWAISTEHRQSMTTTPAAPNTGGRAKNKFLSVAVLVALTALPARDTRADSTFGGSLCSSSNQGPVLIAGSIGLTVDRGQVSYTSTLFQYYVSGTSLEPVLVVHNKVYPLPFGTGTPGNWPFQEFLGPSPVPPACGLPGGIDPGFGIPQPFMFDGTRFAGSFTTHPDLEHSLLAKGGTVLLQIHGTVNSLQDPLFSAPLQQVTIPIPIPFTATFSGANERPPNRSPFRGSGTFTLTGNCLAYSFTVATNFA